MKQSRLFTGADTGAFTLPDEVTTIRRAVATLTGRLAQRPAPVEPVVRDTLARDTLAAALAGQPMPLVDPLLTAADADRATAEQTAALRAALDRAHDDLAGLVPQLRERIMVDHLRPALGETVDAVAAAAGHLPANVDADQVVSLPAAARRAWDGLAALAIRYGVIRDAQDELRRYDPPQRDLENQFGAFANAEVIWPGFRGRAISPAAARPPWPTEPRQRMVWLVANDAEFWLPTPAEQDARWDELYGEAADTAAQGRRQMTATRESMLTWR